MPYINNSSMIQIKVGDRVLSKYHGCIEGTLLSITLTPNNMLRPEIVAMACVQFDNGARLVTCTTNLEPIPSISYEEFYPSSLLSN